MFRKKGSKAKTKRKYKRNQTIDREWLNRTYRSNDDN